MEYVHYIIFWRRQNSRDRKKKINGWQELGVQVGTTTKRHTGNLGGKGTVLYLNCGDSMAVCSSELTEFYY